MTKNNKSLSIKDFLCWLEGVEEMQPDDWTPDASQWKKIRAKISYINDELVVASSNISNYRSDANIKQSIKRTEPESQQESTVIDFGATALDLPATIIPPNAPFIPATPGIAVQTPNIDTSHGKPYKSSFT